MWMFGKSAFDKLIDLMLQIAVPYLPKFFFDSRSTFIGLLQYFFYKNDLPQVVVRMFNNSMQVPVVSSIFFVCEIFPEFKLR